MALSSLIKTKELSGSKHQFYVSLCDILLDLVERDKTGPDALEFSAIGHSLARDFLNLAALAGRLLWYEAVTPDTSRSPDLVAIAVDTETCFVSLRAACDILARAFWKFCVDPKKRGQLPKEKKEEKETAASLRAMLLWARDNPQRLRENFRFLPNHFNWFMKMRGDRDKIVHDGHYLVIYTERDFFQFFLLPGGVAELQQLHGGYREEHHYNNNPRIVRAPLLSWLKKLTMDVLGLADELARSIETQLGVKCSKTHVLDGVYVPALHHLMAYEQPSPGYSLDETEMRRRHVSAWHLLNAGDYLSSIERGYPDGHWWKFLMRLCELFPNPPALVSQPQFARWGVFTEWNFVFGLGENKVVLSLRDSVLFESKWIETVRENLRILAGEMNTKRAVLVAGKNKGPSLLPPGTDLSDFLIIEPNPIVAAEKAFTMLTECQSD
jgi:hypothetical protein